MLMPSLSSMIPNFVDGKINLMLWQTISTRYGTVCEHCEPAVYVVVQRRTRNLLEAGTLLDASADAKKMPRR